MGLLIGPGEDSAQVQVSSAAKRGGAAVFGGDAGFIRRSGDRARVRPGGFWSLAMLKILVFRGVVKNCHLTRKRVVFGPFQTPLVQAITKPSTSQHQATTPREAKRGRVEKHSLFMWPVWRPPSDAAPRGGICCFETPQGPFLQKTRPSLGPARARNLANAHGAGVGSQAGSRQLHWSSQQTVCPAKGLATSRSE